MDNNSSAFPVNPVLSSPLNISSKDKFVLILNLPKVIRERYSNDPELSIETIQISIFGSVVPDITSPPIDVRWGGQSTKFSSYSRPEYPPLTVNFIVDNNFNNYYLLWLWLSILNDPRNSYYGGTDKSPLSNETEYQTTFSVIGLDEYNESTIVFTFHNAFLTSLASINYSYKDSETLECAATFHFGQLSVRKSKKLAF